MERKVIFLDVDGTLVDYHNQLPASAIIAVKKSKTKRTLGLCLHRTQQG